MRSAFVQDEEFHGVKLQMTKLHHIKETARGGDKNIHTLRQRPDLRPLGRATEDHCGA